LIWKTREKHYWRFMVTYLLVSFAGFVTFLAFPASPPWLASDSGYIEPITRISSDVWGVFGLRDFPSVYNTISPNAVAAFPSLHAAYATLFALFIIRLYKSRWRYLALMHPAFIYFGTVYMGEHYAIDEIAGIAYGLVAYFAAPYVLRYTQRTGKKLGRSLRAYSHTLARGWGK
jgi:membrane-associated phospholipid phosphatase